MRRYLVLFLVCISLFLLSIASIKPSRAEVDAGESGVSRSRDAELAVAIRRLADRSPDGLFEAGQPDGGFLLDLQGRFQNVSLVNIGADGDPAVGCVSSIDEANSFFGRNLETGELLGPKIDSPNAATRLAVDHGMSRDEFQFYTDLIEAAARQRADNPQTATLNIVNLDGPGEGFNDPAVRVPEGGNSGTTLGQQRINVFNAAAGIWGAFLDSSVPTQIGAQFEPLMPCGPGGAVAGFAGSVNLHRDFMGAPVAGTLYPTSLANKLSGVDRNGVANEISSTFSSSIDEGCIGPGTRFYYGFDNSTPSGTINLLVVLLHEIGHGLGFQSTVNGSTGGLVAGFPDAYTRFMYDRTAQLYWPQMTDAQRVQSAINTGNLFWDGPNVRIASGYLTEGREPVTNRVLLSAPNPFQAGSSLSHWDSVVSPNLLMEPSFSSTIPLDLDLTRHVMRDIGWYRDTNADLMPDTITNVMPSGETIIFGSTVPITWTNNGGFNRNVTIELSTDGGTTFPTTIAANVANTGSSQFLVPTMPTNQGRIRVREHNFILPLGMSAANFIMAAPLGSPTATVTPTPTPTSTPTVTPSPSPTVMNNKLFDYDGDNKADLSVFRPSNGIWFLDRSRDGGLAIQFGASADKIAPADFDADGKTDIAVYRQSQGLWFVFNSSNSVVSVTQFGIAEDLPAPGDYDGDRRADIAVYRPSAGTWFVLLSGGGSAITQFGAPGDVPAPGDYDGDGRNDLVVFRPSNGVWFERRSQLGDFAIQFGNATDKIAPADYDGDNRMDVAIYRPSQTAWYIVNSSNGTQNFVVFGLTTDIPVPADYDGDGRADIGIYRPQNGQWWISRSTVGLTVTQFGLNGDKPTQNAYGN